VKGEGDEQSSAGVGRAPEGSFHGGWMGIGASNGAPDSAASATKETNRRGDQKSNLEVSVHARGVRMK
jgi:hypothetical protein